MKLRVIAKTVAAIAATSIPAFSQVVPSADESDIHWTVEGGTNYLEGDFGFSQTTRLWMQTASLQFEEDPIRVQLMVPFISITGPASVVGEVGRPTTSRERGLGDVTVAATYKFSDPSSGVSDVDFTARVKLPTADDEKGLGTGKTDTEFEVNLHHKFGTLVPFATVGYRFLGRSDLYPLRDGLYSTGGLATPLSDATVGGVALSWRERITEDADNATEAMAFISHKIDERWKVQGYALKGFTDASPDFGLGGSVGIRF